MSPCWIRSPSQRRETKAYSSAVAVRMSVKTVLGLCLALSSYAAPPIRPDSRLTPGATLDVTTDDVCTPGYTKKVRNVPAKVKRQVFAEYHVEYVPKAYEVDHLISL